MSTTYSIACHSHKEQLWIAQSNYHTQTFYSGDAVIMKKLEAFLFNHVGCELEFSNHYNERIADYADPSADTCLTGSQAEQDIDDLSSDSKPEEEGG